MAKKLFSNLQVRVHGSNVEVSFYLGTPLFTDRGGKGQSIPARIYRREEPEFTFNHDYAEYFDGLSLEDADLLFEGPLELINHRKAIYDDRSVKTGATYVYWVAPIDGGMATGPVAVRVRDSHIWWSQEEIERRVRGISEVYSPKVLLRTYGHTVRGRTISGLHVGNTQRTVALIGAIHPGESGPELIIPAIERLLRENDTLLDKTGMAVLPSVCIDEREKLVQGNPWYLRKNFNQVDLNRNFPAEWECIEYTYGLITSDPDAATYRGVTPCSEPETQAVMKFLEDTKPICVFSFHCLASICGPSFFATQYAEDDSHFKKQCERFAAPYAAGFYGAAPETLQLQFACTAGSLTSWLYQQWKIPAFDLEWDGEEKSRISHTDNTTRELLAEYQDRHYQALVQLLREI